MVIPRTVEGVRSFTNEREREREIKGTVGERLGGATRGRYGGGTKDHRWRICTVDRISRAGHARNLAERNHVLPRFGARLGEDAEWRDYDGEVGYRWRRMFGGEFIRFCQPDSPKFAMFVLLYYWKILSIFFVCLLYFFFFFWNPFDTVSIRSYFTGEIR